MLELYAINTQIHRRHCTEAYSLASSSLVALLTRFVAPSPSNRITSHEFNTSPYILQAFEVLHGEYRILDAVGSTPLIVAAAVNDLPMIQRNLAQRKQKNFLGYTALATAVIHHHIEPYIFLPPLRVVSKWLVGKRHLSLHAKKALWKQFQSWHRLRQVNPITLARQR